MTITCHFCGGDHGGTITPDVSLECAMQTVDQLRACLRDAAEWVEWAANHCPDAGDRMAAQHVWERIGESLGGE